MARQLNVVFTEMNEEFGAQQIIGNKDYGVTSEEEATKSAQEYAKVLSDVRGKKVNFYLTNDQGSILADAPLVRG